MRRQRRKKRVRRNVTGTADCPRLSVFRSHKNIYAQIIDDSAGHTLVAASSREQSLADRLEGHCGNKTAAKAVGEALAAKAIEAGIKEVVFDRNGYPFHGRIRELAQAAREGGLQF
ncbi:MAG: 50S ribosomal protein L18 [Phycisphaerae bacterium]